MTRRFPIPATLVATVLLAPGALGAQQRPLTPAEAVDAVLSTHPTLLAAVARIEGAEADAARARSAWLPGVVADGGVTRFQEPMIVAPLHGFDPTRPPSFERTLVQGRLGVAWTVYDGGARGARIDGSRAGADAADARRTGAEAGLLEEAAAAYLGVQTARELLRATEAWLEALAAEADLARQRVDEGAAPRVAVLRADAALSDARAQAAAARARLDVAQRSLARLMGVPVTAVADRPMATVRPASATPVERDGPASETAAVRAARLAAAAAETRVAEARAGRAPSVNAAAGLLTFGSTAGAFDTEWQAGVQVSWPLFTGGARGATVRRSQADLTAARADLRAAELKADEARAGARAAVEEAAARRNALEASVVQWEEVARIEALALAAGAGVQTDFLRAQASLFQARAGRTAAVADEALARVRLARAQADLTPRTLITLLEIVP
ncbi:MAG: TolC family protein [Longimicrobiales bacterium]